MRLSEAVSQFTAYLAGNGHSPRTATLYGAVLRAFCTATRDKALRAVAPADLFAFMDAQKHLTPATRNVHRAALRSLCNWAVGMGYLGKSPAAMLKAERIPQREAAYLKPEQVSRLLAVLGKAPLREQTLFNFYLGTGVRLREAIKLNVRDVRGKAVVTVIGKGNKARQIFLSPYLTGLVDKLTAGRPDAAPLFESNLGRRLCARRVQQVFKVYLTTAGIRGQYGVHALRHTFCTVVYSRTKDLRLVMELAGHASPNVTCRYAHVGDAAKRAAVCGLYQ